MSADPPTSLAGDPIAPPPAYNQRQRSTDLSRRPQKEHTFTLKNSKQNPWATLTLKSSAHLSASLPLYSAPEEITGTLAVDADKVDSPHFITISITGSVVTSASAKELKFLEIVRYVWSKPSLQRRNQEFLQSQSPGVIAGKSKLEGLCVWPFSIPVPSEVVVKGNTYGTPETFSERHVPVGVNYQISARFGRGTFRPDKRLTATFAFVPRSVSPTPSSLRLLAYGNGVQVPSPSEDPSDWSEHFLGGVPVTINNQRIFLRTTFHVSQPNIYGRGSQIHVHLTLQNPSSFYGTWRELVQPQVVLRRTVQYFIHPSATRPDTAGWKTSVNEFGLVSWSAPQLSEGGQILRMQGDLRVERNLYPTSHLDQFSTAYHLIVKSLIIDESNVQESRPFIEYPVTITTHSSFEGSSFQRRSLPHYDDNHNENNDDSPRSGPSSTYMSTLASREEARAAQMERGIMGIPLAFGH